MTPVAVPGTSLACVLVHPEHGGNVGAAARALGNLGLEDLRLVGDPDDDLRGAQARAMACAFQEILAAAAPHADLDAALADCVFAVAMVSPMRHRDVATHDLRALRPRIVEASRHGKVALVFGSEQSGLSHADVARCDVAAHLGLPSPRPTLNLAQAVLLAGYELRRDDDFGARDAGAPPPSPGATRATHAEVSAALRGLDDLLARLGYGSDDAPLHARIRERCRSVAHRAGLTRDDLQMLHGLLARLDPRTC